MRRRWRALTTARDEGSVTIEMLLVTPVLVAFLLLVVALGQVVSTRIDLDGAAAAAARAASVSSSPAGAQSAAQQSVTGAGGLGCSSVQVATNTADFVAGGEVAVTLTCQMDLAPFDGLHLPASTSFSSTATEPLDTYRSYNP